VSRPGFVLMKAFVALVGLFWIFGAGGPVLAQEEKFVPPPEVDAEAWVVSDADSGRVLAGTEPDKRLPIASTTKIMVALVALDEGVDFDEEVTVSENAASYAGFEYSNIGLFTGDEVSVEELMLASLVPSATDAVYALSEHLGDGSVKTFVGKMNDKAGEMGLENTHFENPAGLDSKEHYSSARDLTEITAAAMEYPEFRKMVSTVDASITTKDRRIEFSNTNFLLNTYSAATGVKTGTTPEGGASLVSSAESGDESYIAVVLGAVSEEERFAGSRRGLEYAFENYERKILVPKDKVYDEIDVPFRREESIEVSSEKNVEVLVGPGVQVERQITTKKAPAAVMKGDEIGEVEVLVDGRNVGNTPLVAEKGYEEASFFQKSWHRISGLWK